MTRPLLPPGLVEAILEQLAEGVLIADTSGRILYVNAAFERLTGYRREEILGQNPRVLKSGEHPLEFYRQFWHEILSGRSFRGVFVNRRKDGTLYTEEKVVTPIRGASGRVEYLVATSRDVTEEMALRARLEELSTHDPLTGLLNRRAFAREVENHLLNSGAPRALAYLDLDRFKAVNDALGHGVGDEVLARLGRRLREALPEDGILARMGGDEFAAWFPARDIEQAKARGVALLEAAGLVLEVDDQPLRLEGSLGIAVYPDHGVTLSELLRRADLAMYRAKLFRLSHPEVFTPDLDGLTPQTLALEAEFHRALAEGRAVLVFQSIEDRRRGGFTGAEVLFRIRGAEGYFNPLGHLDLSRRSVNEALDRFVVTQLRKLQGRYPELIFWINVTPWSLGDQGFLALMEREVYRGLESKRVVLEISERLALPHLSRITPALWRLKTLGFRLALDDFGVGQTSLLHLRSLPLDFLKVSRELLWAQRGAHGAIPSVLGHLVALAHDLGLEVVVEGVETEEDLTTALALGADMVQGFLVHVPSTTPRGWETDECP